MQFEILGEISEIKGLEMPKPASRQLAVCVNSADYPASLERRKIYVTVRDAAAA